MTENLIKAAEDKYKVILENHCRDLFSDTYIPSHDHLHHARVWEYAKEIMRHLFNAGMTDDRLLPEKAIIAVFFHDTGLTVNKGADHGKESRKICREFLLHQDTDPECHNEILDAVEKHDDKNYGSAAAPASLESIVAVADDMDAFGHTGVLRYWEIYTMRRLDTSDIPQMIITNAESRFRHLESTYHMFPDLISEQKARLDFLVSFYTSLMKSL